MKKIILLFIFLISVKSGDAQCPGVWTSVSALNYLCANGPFLQYDLASNPFPAAAQCTYRYSAPQSSVGFHFSAFGSLGSPGQSRLEVLLNGKPIDLHHACSISIGCQTPAGTYSIDNSGYIVDSVSGDDGGISGEVILIASDFGLATIDSLGVSVSEPSASGTIFQIDSTCNPVCISNGVISNNRNTFIAIYPNPAEGQTDIHLPANGQPCTVIIYNTLGQLVKKAEVGNASYYAVSRSDIGDGMFFCNIEQGSQIIYRGKFIFSR